MRVVSRIVAVLLVLCTLASLMTCLDFAIRGTNTWGGSVRALNIVKALFFPAMTAAWFYIMPLHVRWQPFQRAVFFSLLGFALLTFLAFTPSDLAINDQEAEPFSSMLMMAFLAAAVCLRVKWTPISSVAAASADVKSTDP